MLRTWLCLPSPSESHGAPEPARRVLTSQNTSVSVVGDDEVELAEAGAVVAGDDLVAEALEVLCGELLAAAAELVAGVGGHHRPDARRDPVTDLHVSVATLCRSCTV